MWNYRYSLKRVIETSGATPSNLQITPSVDKSIKLIEKSSGQIRNPGDEKSFYCYLGSGLIL